MQSVIITSLIPDIIKDEHFSMEEFDDLTFLNDDISSISSFIPIADGMDDIPHLSDSPFHENNEESDDMSTYDLSHSAKDLHHRDEWDDFSTSSQDMFDMDMDTHSISLPFVSPNFDDLDMDSISSRPDNRYLKNHGFLDDRIQAFDDSPATPETPMPEIPTASVLASCFSDNDDQKEVSAFNNFVHDNFMGNSSRPISSLYAPTKPVAVFSQKRNSFFCDEPNATDMFSLPTSNLAPRTILQRGQPSDFVEADLIKLFSPKSLKNSPDLCSSSTLNLDVSNKHKKKKRTFIESVSEPKRSIPEGLQNWLFPDLCTRSAPNSDASTKHKKKKLLLTSSVSEPETSIPKGSGIIVNSAVNLHRKSLVTQFTDDIFSELEIVKFTQTDRKGNRTKVPLAFPGMACRHCKGSITRTGRYFPSSLKTLADSKKTLFAVHRHMSQCKLCPEATKDKIQQSFDQHKNEFKEKSKRHGSQRAYFRILWDTIHPRQEEGKK